MKRLIPLLVLAVAITVAIYRGTPGSPDKPTTSPVGSEPAAADTSSRFPSPPLQSSSTAPASPPPTNALTEEITHALRNGSPEKRDRAFNELLPRLIAQDPAAAGHLALAWEAGTLRDEFLRHVIRLWSATDIGGAVTWLASLLDAGDRDLASAASTAQVAQADRAGALDLAQALRVGLDDGSLERMAQLWTEEEPNDAVRWVLTQPGGATRDRLLARIAYVRAQQEPAQAADLVLNHLPAGEARDEALLSVVRQWAVRDPAGAATWVAQFPAGPLQTRAHVELETASRPR